MSITVNHATLARQVNGEIEYIYPKTSAELVEYDSSQSVKEKIDSIISNTENNSDNKLDKPIDEDGIIDDGIKGQVLESNGDGTTSWVNSDKIKIGVDKSLTAEGMAADAKAVGEAIDGIKDFIDNIDDGDKVNKPLDSDGISTDGEAGQVLETNGDGTTSWVTRARVYVGDGEMPEGYDVQIDPEATVIEIDRTLSVDGGIAEASATGAAINNLKTKITTDIEAHNTDSASHVDIRAMITDAKDYILMKDSITGEEYKVIIENGQLVIKSTVIRPTSIIVTSNPTKTSYEVGELFNAEGMVITVNYDDGTSKEVTNYTYSTMGLTAGTTSVLITYIEAGVTVTVNVPITVVVRCIGINVTTNPIKTQYYIGDTFNTAGMIVAATYTDGTVKAVTNYTYPTTALTKDTTLIPITYEEDGYVFTTNVIITVVAKYTGIRVKTTPAMTSYTEGEVFNPGGMVIYADYNDDTYKVIDNYTYPKTPLTVGMTSITISYTENGITHTTIVSITVKAAFDTNILKDFTYVTNADGTYTLTGWKGTKNGVASTEVVIPDSPLIIVNPSVL